MPELPRLSPIAAAPLSVVLLARNQAPHVETVLAAWVTYLNGLDRPHEVIVVDDGSSDDTAAAAEKFAASAKLVRVIRQAPPHGEGAALRTGLLAAAHPLLFYTLCHPYYQPADLGVLLRKRSDPSKPELEIDSVHILSASRAGRTAPWPWRLVGLCWRMVVRVLLAHSAGPLPGWLGWRRHLGAWLTRTLFGVRYRDVACPFRLLRRDILPRIPLQAQGFFAHVELLAKANYLGLIMGEEVPLPPGHYPPLTPDIDGAETRLLLADARRVVCRPDFGTSARGTA